MSQSRPLTANGLSAQSDFALGGATIRPSLRKIEGPAGSYTLEPRVMQVLLALHDACPGVLGRSELLERCWGGVFVGDDAVNRTIAEIRRAIRDTGAGFVVETVPRVGYRLVTAGAAAPDDVSDGPSPPPVARRSLLLAGMAGAAVLLVGGVGIHLIRQRRAFAELMAEGIELERRGDPGSVARAQTAFRGALAIDDRSPEAWGRLARVLDDSKAARDAANRALALDPANADARMTLLVQQRDLTSWAEWETRVEDILGEFPEHDLALDTMVLFQQGVGRCRQSWELNERAAQAEPFDPIPLTRRAIKHWIFGRIAAGDKVADKCVELWPSNPYVWNTRIMLYAYTDRATAGLAFLDDAAVRPANLGKPSIETWRAVLTAVGTRARADVAEAVRVCSETASLAPGLAANAVMALSWLGEVDGAMRVAQGLFAARGPIVQKKRGRGIRDLYSESAWARSQFLFVPATAPLREDPRFTAICESAGLLAYWREKGIAPDPFVRGSLRLS